MVSEIDLAWLAGIIDGEGSLLLKRHKQCDSVMFRVAVFNTDPVIADNAKHIIGLILGKDPTVYSVRRAKTHRVLFHVTVDCRDKVARLLTAVLPYLRGKKREAEIVLAVYRLCPKRSGGWNRWGRPIPLSSQVDRLLKELKDERWGHLPVGDAEPSCAGAVGSAEGATATPVTAKNNPGQERAASLRLPFGDDDIA